MRDLRVEESATGFRCSWLYPPFPASCPFRSTLAAPTLSPLTDPTVRDYRSGFLKCVSPHHAKSVGYAAATRDVLVGAQQMSPRSSPFRECAG